MDIRVECQATNQNPNRPVAPAYDAWRKWHIRALHECI